MTKGQLPHGGRSQCLCWDQSPGILPCEFSMGAVYVINTLAPSAESESILHSLFPKLRAVFWRANVVLEKQTSGWIGLPRESIHQNSNYTMVILPCL